MALAAPLESAGLFRLGTLLIGFGGGLFAVGTLTAAMNRDETSNTGLALGAWGAVQATAAGAGVALGGLVRDLAGAAADAGVFGLAAEGPATGYGIVYAIEIVLLFATLAAGGRLVRSHVNAAPARPFGLAEMPG